MNIQDLIAKASKRLKSIGIEASKNDAVDLLAFHLSCQPSDLYLRFKEEVSDELYAAYSESLRLRLNRTPIAYIMGKVSFYGVDIKVDPRVLVPRQETELMVDEIAKVLTQEDLEGKILWDICTGSGCIGLSLKNKFKKLSVTCSDFSEPALDLAKENAEENNLNVLFEYGSLLQPFDGEKADYIVSNPPYVSADEYAEVEEEVLKEPKVALYGGKSGLDPYLAFARSLPGHLNSGGKAWFEMGSLQGKALKEIFSTYPWKEMRILQDLSGKDRVFFLEKE